MSDKTQEKRKSAIESAMADNKMFSMWTSTWGFSIKPCYGIDKLEFSFVEKGAGGKGKSFDVYVDTVKDGVPCFDNLAYDILHDHRFEATMKAEKASGEKYPKTYKFVSGENGSCSVGICNSTNGSGLCVNASAPNPADPTKKVFCNIPISYHDIRRIAERYTETYAARKDELNNILLEAGKKFDSQRSSWRDAQAAQAFDSASQDAYMQAAGATQQAEPKEVVQNTQPQPITVQTQPQAAEPASQPAVAQQTSPYPVLDVKIASKIAERQSFPGDYSAVGFTSDGKKKNIVFPGVRLTSIMDYWNQLLAYEPEGSPIQLKFYYEAAKEGNTDICRFVSFAA